MKADKLALFEQAVSDLHFNGLVWRGTCPACHHQTLQLKPEVLPGQSEAKTFQPVCDANCSEAAIREGVRLALGGNGRAATNGSAPQAPAAARPPPGKPWQSARELMAKEIPALEWVVPGIIPEGLSILAGRPKQGKSWGIYGIGVAVATGGKAFGVKPVCQGDVLYLALEDGERRLKERLGIILRGSAIPERFDWAIQWPRLAGPGHLPTRENPDCRSQILWWLDEHPDARMVAIDTLARVKPKSQKNGNAYEQDYAVMEPLQALAAERRIGLVLVTHTRKPMKGGSPTDVFDEIMDSTGITGGADTMLVLKKTRREQELSLWVTGRDVEDQELLIEWDADTSDWKLLGPAQEQRTTALRQSILDCLRRTGDVMGFSEVAARIDRDTTEGRAIVKTTLYRLVDQDLVLSPLPGKFRAKPQGDRRLAD